MTDTKAAPKTASKPAAPKSGANADVAAGVAQFLTPVVQELVALAVIEAIADVIAQIDLAAEKVGEAIEGLDELDPVSQDVAIEIRRGLDKDRWFLFSHVAVK